MPGRPFSARGGSWRNRWSGRRYETSCEVFRRKRYGGLLRRERALVRRVPANLETNDAVSSAMANLVSPAFRWILPDVCGQGGKVSRADVKRWRRDISRPMPV